MMCMNTVKYLTASDLLAGFVVTSPARMLLPLKRRNPECAELSDVFNNSYFTIVRTK